MLKAGRDETSVISQQPFGFMQFMVDCVVILSHRVVLGRLYGYESTEVVGKANCSIPHAPEDLAANRHREIPVGLPAPGPRVTRTARRPLRVHPTGVRRIAGGWALLAALASMLYLSGGLAAEPRVLVLSDANSPPFSNPERTGFFDVVATEAFRRARLELRLDQLPAERALLLSNSGVTDGELNRLSGIELLYPNLIRVPEKLGDWSFTAFSKDASIPGNFKAISGRPVGFIRGWKIYERALAGAAHVTVVDNPEQLFRLLQLNRIDVALYASAMGVEYLRRRGIVDVRVLEPVLFIRETFIYLHKSHADLVPVLAAALREMKRDGTYQRDYNEKLLPYLVGEQE